MNFFPPSTAHLSVTGIPSRRGPFLCLSLLFTKGQRLEKGGSKGDRKAERKHEWGRAIPGEWERILSDPDESRTC